MNGVRRTLANLNQILAKQKKRESKGYSGIGWLDAVLRQGNEEEGSSSGGDEANSDVGQRDVEMEDELGLKNVSFLRLYWICRASNCQDVDSFQSVVWSTSCNHGAGPDI